MSVNFTNSLDDTLMKHLKTALDTLTKQDFDFVMTDKEFYEYLERIESLTLKELAQGFSVIDEILKDIKNRKPTYGVCTKKPVKVEFREVRENESSIATLEGNMYCNKDKHYIIKGVDGEEYPIEKSIFYKTYEVDKPCSSLE